MSLSLSPLPTIATNSHTQFGMMVTPPSSPCFKTPPSPGFKTPKRNLTLPSVSPVTSLATLPAPPLSPKPRRKALGPGCGLLDWIRLCRSGKDLTAVGGKPVTVTEEELAKHNTPDDAWTAIRGKVYNITPYMKFHPGGKEDLMRGAGKDCTILFDEVHSWVNVESMLSKCIVGTLVISPSARRNSMRKSRADSLSVPKPIVVVDGMNSQAIPKRKSSMEMRDETRAAEASEEVDGQRQVSPDSPVKPLIHEMPGTRQDASAKQEHEFVDEPSATLPVPPMRPRKNSDASKPNPSFNWVQSEKSVVLHVLTQGKALKPSDVLLDINGKTFEATIFINDWVYELNIALAHPVCGSQVTVNGARAEITLRKKLHEQWDILGSFLPGHGVVTHKGKRDPKTHLCTIVDIKTVTHDTKVFTVKFPPGSFMTVPTGHHVTIKARIDGKEVKRSYTPVLPLNDCKQTDGNSLEFMIKLYKSGKMSQYLSKLKIGDSMVVTDPEGTFDSSRLHSASNVVLIAAGTGFTPMVKVIRDLVGSNEHKVNRSTKLLFANKREKDILWRSELEQLAKSTQSFELVTILSDPGNAWRGRRGRIDGRVLKEHLPPVTEGKTLICVCGPCPFTTGISNILFDMEYPDDYIHCFT